MVEGMITSVWMGCYLAWAAAGGIAPVPGVCAHADEVRRFSFEFDDDQDYDGQPDDWSRRRGRGFPHYVQAGIDRSLGSNGKQSLRFDLNGGQAVYYSPLIRVDTAHSYVLRGMLRTEGLQHDAALISISLLDHKRRRVKRILSRPVIGTHRKWVEVEIGPVLVEPTVRFLVLGCHVVEGEKSDVRGSVWFDDIWLGSLPRLVLRTHPAQHYFKTGEPIRIDCDVLGLSPEHTHRLALSLEDVDGEIVERTSVPLEPVAAAAPVAPNAELPVRKPHAWNLPPQTNGFYRVRAAVERGSICVLEETTTFVIMELDEQSPAGDFGWSVSSGIAQIPLESVADIAAQSGINWLKLPLWTVSNYEQRTSITGLSQFMDRLEEQNITLIGLLNEPPPQVSEKFAQHWVGVSKIFTMPRDFWYPSLEPIIARYSFRVRHWQLGGEDDDSFVGLQSLPETVASVKKEFDRIGHDSRIGFHWDWKQEFPKADRIDHTFLSLHSKPQLDPAELEQALRATENGGLPRHVLLKPLPVGEHTADFRAAHLARLMIAAKLGKADAIFVSDPLDPRHGLLNPDGSPGDLFLPWRTMAMALRSARYIGEFEMTGRSPNAIFETPHEVLMVLWNDQPTREESYVGEQAFVVDLWGHRSPVETNATTGRQVIDVGPMPVLVRGCNEGVVRWLLSAKFEKGWLKSEYGAHDEAILVKNTFSQGISGRAVLHMPPEWEVEPNHWSFQAAVGENIRLPTLLTLPPDAGLGKLRPSIDFEISADRPYKFTCHLPYQLGTGDVDLDVTSRFTNDGRLEVEQRITNNTDPLEILNFNCSLFIPGQIRQKQVVTKLIKGQDKRFYYIPNAGSLRGKRLWLRAEQIDGRRVLNYHWTAGETKDEG